VQKGYFSPTAFDHLRQGSKGTLAEDSDAFGGEWTPEKVRAAAEHMPIGSPDEIVERIIAECDEAGAHTVMLVCNRGAMPYEMYLNQIRRIGREVLPRLQKHKIKTVKFAEGVAASN
jgi:alkanesulfonate monooxygenase SsuD/methylene tetrahydromethanopterin reductase-like flavin-dependent oxidoreductase (luciferase family)